MKRDEQFLWVEKYRPKTISECILTDSLRKTFLGVLGQNNIPNFLFTGTAGTGKTTVARALCEELNCDVLMINGSLGADESGIEAFRTKVRSFASSVSFSNRRKVVLVDEADYLNPNSVQPALRGLIEEFSKNCGFIFTCNYKNRLIEQIHSRCSVVEFRISREEKTKIVSEFLKRIVFILESEDIKYDCQKVLVEFIAKYFPDFRRIINELQRFAVANNEINVSILSKQSDLSLNFPLLLKAIKEKDYTKTREWVASSMDNDISRVFRKFYDHSYEFFVPQKIPEIIVTLADYQYKSAFVVDQEVNLLAFLVEIMVMDAVK